MAAHFQILVMILIHVLVLLGSLGLAISSKHKTCEPNHFFEPSEERCKRCSGCPPNQIVYRMCSNKSDVLCKPYYFTDFKSSNSGDSELLRNFYQNHNFNDNENNQNQQKPVKNSDDLNNSPATVEKGDKEYWKKLALALIGALSLLVVVGTITCIILGAKVHRSSIVKLPEEGDTGK